MGTLAFQSWYRGAIQGKTRIALAWLFSIALVLTSRETPSLLGILICFLGAALRFWASGYLRKDSKPAVGGPYAFSRNPLYLGTYLMAVGAAISTSNWAFVIFLSVVFAAIYHFIILDEEEKLSRIFGPPYAKYRELVPRFFPRLFPAPKRHLLGVNPELEHQRFSWDIAWKNRAYEAFAAWAALIAFVYLSAHFWRAFLT